jgi:hypothetical protein
VTSSDEEEKTICRVYAEFGALATKGEQSILTAVARIRSSIIRNGGTAKTRSGTNDPTGNGGTSSLLFPQCANVLRQTAAWQKISKLERDRIERDLLTLP